jgi:hypothetical protein
MDALTRFVGGPPARVFIQLVVLSLVVGVVLSALGVSPFDIANGLARLAERLWNTGFDTLIWAWRYFLLGAVIVFPIWLVARLLKASRRQGSQVQL